VAGNKGEKSAAPQGRGQSAQQSGHQTLAPSLQNSVGPICENEAAAATVTHLRGMSTMLYPSSRSCLPLASPWLPGRGRAQSSSVSLASLLEAASAAGAGQGREQGSQGSEQGAQGRARRVRAGRKAGESGAGRLVRREMWLQGKRHRTWTCTGEERARKGLRPELEGALPDLHPVVEREVRAASLDGGSSRGSRGVPGLARGGCPPVASRHRRRANTSSPPPHRPRPRGRPQRAPRVPAPPPGPPRPRESPRSASWRLGWVDTGGVPPGGGGGRGGLAPSGCCAQGPATKGPLLFRALTRAWVWPFLRGQKASEGRVRMRGSECFQGRGSPRLWGGGEQWKPGCSDPSLFLACNG